MPHKLADVIDKDKAGAVSLAEELLEQQLVIVGYQVEAGLNGAYAIITLADGRTTRTSSAIVIRQLNAIDPDAFKEGVEATMVKKGNFFQLQ